MLIGGFQKTSLIDFPKKIAAIVFTHGCNFRCRYCHNPELVTGIEKIADENYILDFLDTRKGKLDGVVVTGGEPTLQKDLPKFLRKIKDKGFLIKLDTNGSNFEVLKNVANEGLVDYIAMDIKGPLDKYEKIIDTSCDVLAIKESVDFIKQNNIDYEFRTTVVKPLLEPNDFEYIGNIVEGAKRYFIQNFVYSKILDNGFKNPEPFNKEELLVSAEILKKHNVIDVKIR